MRGLDVSGSIILKWNIKKYDGIAWTDLSCSRQGKEAVRYDSNIGSYEMENISWLAGVTLAHEEKALLREFISIGNLRVWYSVELIN